MLPLLWGLWCLTALMQAPPASAAFLPLSLDKLLQPFINIMEEMLGKARFEPLDFSKLPASYHGEEKKQETVGNATVYSHREISKMINNSTGQMLFSEKTALTSIERGHSEEKEKDDKPAANQLEVDMQVSGTKILKFRPTENRRRLTFLIFHLPRHLSNEQQMSEVNWEKEEPVSDRKNRLLAIRNGLLAAPRSVTQTAPPTTQSRVYVPRKRHFFFFWRKI